MDADFAARLGAVIGARRVDAGLTQAKLAELCDVATETIGRIERGLQIPSLERLLEIARHLGARSGDLLLSADEKLPPSRRELAIRRLSELLRRRSADDAELIFEMTQLIFRRWPELGE